MAKLNGRVITEKNKQNTEKQTTTNTNNINRLKLY